MKTKYLIFASLLCFTLQSQAQIRQISLGLQFKPTKTIYTRSESIPATLNMSGGFFAHLHLRERLRIGTGVFYQELKHTTVRLTTCPPLGILAQKAFDETFRLMKIPFNIGFQVLPLASKNNLHLVAGMAYGNLKNAKTAERDFFLKNLQRDVFFVAIGLEWSRPVFKKYQVSLGTHLELTDIYNARYALIENFQLVVGFGYVFSAK